MIWELVGSRLVQAAVRSAASLSCKGQICSAGAASIKAWRLAAGHGAVEIAMSVTLQLFWVPGSCVVLLSDILPAVEQ